MGPALFYVAFHACALALAWSVYAAWRDGRMLTVPIVAWGMPLMLLFLPLLSDPRGLTQDARFAALLLTGIMGTALGILLARGMASGRQPELVQRLELPAVLVYGGAVLYVAFLVMTILDRVRLSGGVLAALTVARLEEYLGGAILEGRSLEVLFILPQILYFVLIGRLLSGRRWFWAIGLVAAVSLYYIFTANTRLPIVFPWVALAVVIAERLPLRTYRAVAPVAATFALIAVAVVVVVGSALRLGTVEDLASLSGEYREAVSAQAAADLGYPDWVRDVQRAVDTGKVGVDAGYGWLVLGPLSLVPRAVWPGKPLTSASNRLTELVYDVKIGDGTPITTFTVYGDGYFQAGYMGVFVGAAAFVLGYSLLLTWMRRFQHTEFWAAMVLLHMVTFFRGELPVPDFLVWTGALILFAMVSRRVQRTATEQLPT